MASIVIDGKLVDEPANLTTQRLADQNSSALPPASVLAQAASIQQRSLANGGVTITIDGSVTVLASTNSDGRIDLNGLYTMAKQNPSLSTIWVQSTGAITLTAAQIILVGDAVLAFYQETYSALASINNLITTSQLTTIAGVNSSTLWPSTTINLTSAPAPASTPAS